MAKRIDLTGKVFGELTVLSLSDKKKEDGTRLWECSCSCGETTTIAGSALRAGHYKSCGCKREEKRDIGVKEHLKNDRVDGTRKSALRTKLHKGNKSGVKGVRYNEQRKKWTANIGFRGKQINLGYYTNKEEAVNARVAAEKKYFEPVLEEE